MMKVALSGIAQGSNTSVERLMRLNESTDWHGNARNGHVASPCQSSSVCYMKRAFARFIFSGKA
jgi:hypothetical protein